MVSVDGSTEVTATFIILAVAGPWVVHGVAAWMGVAGPLWRSAIAGLAGAFAACLPPLTPPAGPIGLALLAAAWTILCLLLLRGPTLRRLTPAGVGFLVAVVVQRSILEVSPWW